MVTIEWNGDRVAEGARLEIVCAERYRGFESLPFRKSSECTGPPQMLERTECSFDRRRCSRAPNAASTAADARAYRVQLRPPQMLESTKCSFDRHIYLRERTILWSRVTLTL
jgi:hypothetical protein